MSFVPNTNEDYEEMLAKIGVSNFEELINNIPESARLNEPLDLPDALSELDTIKYLETLAKKNKTASENICFIGGGIYDHYIPEIVNSILQRPEFKTAYTPYQAEVSQGTLQAMYEFQTMIARLTAMDVSNASLYDGASALAEACFMAENHTKKTEFLIAGSVSPFYKQVTSTFTKGRQFTFKQFVSQDGTANIDELKSNISQNSAAIIVQNPNFLGNLEDVFELEKIAHQNNMMYIAIFNPISLGLLIPPGKYNADIAVGEGQSLGIPMSFGGPALGLFTCKEQFLRLLPGRISGMSIDKDGNRCFVLTLQTREQQIKREKATSNICTNQGLMMLAATVYLETMGKQGIKEVAEQCYHKAHYLAQRICEIPGFALFNNKPFFNEFTIKPKTPASVIIDRAIDEGFFAGIDTSKYTDFDNGLIIAVTEKRTRDEMDKFVEFLKKM
ncbi:MAG TPA: aminomethyl-transferring glycine dehydrogenase subunit GcvPA [Bacteroidota bacterium]|nr:aminomethyl-transferring glycine dehydrogenase subunit GcvPA [Bacteroidota bacterium]HRT67676.1 aminomethyl-transferring glycine dehydrogenase subunit GcvPA [Bacteroidota bacterium]